MLHASIEASNIGHLLADVISVDAIETYKPSTAAYALVEPSLGIPRQEILFVSSNSFDVIRAKRLDLVLPGSIGGGAKACRPTPTSVHLSFSSFFAAAPKLLKYEADVRLQALPICLNSFARR